MPIVYNGVEIPDTELAPLLDGLDRNTVLNVDDVTVTAAQINAAVGELAAKSVGTATFGTLTAESSEARTQSIQLKDYLGADMAVKSVVKVYVSSDSAGLDAGDGDATIALSAGTDGSMIGTDESGAWFISEADGDLDVILTDSAAATASVYLNVVSPLGEVFTSGAIAFAA